MTTIVTYGGRGPAGIGAPFALATAEESAIFALRSALGGPITEWWQGPHRAFNSDQDNFHWDGRINGTPLNATGLFNGKIVAAGLNSKQVVGLKSGAGLRATTLSLPASADFSFAMVVKMNNTAVAVRGLWGASDTTNNSYTRTAAGGQLTKRNNVNQINSANALGLNTSATLVYGWKNSSNRATLRRDGAQIAQVTSAQAGPSGHLTIGGYGTASGSLFGSSSGTDGDPDLFADIIYCNGADLTDVVYATQLATIEASLRTLWATW